MFFLKMKIRTVFKKIIYYNFITKFVGRLLTQRLYKSLALIKDNSRLKGTLWVDCHKSLFETWAKKKNKKLYFEANNFFLKFYKEKKKKILNLPISGGIKNSKSGGGGNEILLYFLVRLINAKNILETGVSAGSSSRCILEGLAKNGLGTLYSSDLATVLKKKDVGILVLNQLKKNWILYHDGDKKNLPKIFKKNKLFDIIYYDSDKSYSAKKWFHNEIIKINSPKLLIYDDIDRDLFFSEYVKLYNYKYKVFGSVGIIYFDKTFL